MMHKLLNRVKNPILVYLIFVGFFSILTFTLFNLQAKAVLGIENISLIMYLIPVGLGLLIGSLFGKTYLLLQKIASTQRQLYQSEKLASIGQLAAGVAHEVNNPISFIKSNLNSAKYYISDLRNVSDAIKSAQTVEQIKDAWRLNELDDKLDDFSDLMDESIDGADRVTKIVNDLRTFSNIDRNEEEFADINEIIQSVCNVAANEINKKAILTVDTGDIPKTMCRPGFLGQAFINILVNATNAVDENGEINISSGTEGGKICIRISDNGCGIPEDLIHRIFDPFLTTQKVGEGTGLGLTVSSDIIKSHQGNLEVESRPGKGSMFIIRLPIITERPKV